MTNPFQSVLTRTLLGPLITVTQLFGLYVLIHGHYSPGGGFQGGVLVAAVFILPMLVYGRDRSQPAPTGLVRPGPDAALVMGAIGVLIFAGTGLASLVQNASFLDYGELPLAQEASMRRSMGILVIEIGVTLAVAGAVLAIFHALYRDEPEDDR